MYNGQHIEYFEDILNGLDLTGTVPLLSLLGESFSHLRGGGIQGIRDITEQLGLNLTEILEILNGSGLGIADLTQRL